MLNCSPNCILPVRLEMVNFFSHENQSFPPSLSRNGDLRSGIKSYLLICLEDIHPCSLKKPAVCVIFDGLVIAPVNSSTFRDYASKVFSPGNRVIGLTLLGNFIKKIP